MIVLTSMYILPAQITAISTVNLTFVRIISTVSKHANRSILWKDIREIVAFDTRHAYWHKKRCTVCHVMYTTWNIWRRNHAGLSYLRCASFKLNKYIITLWSLKANHFTTRHIHHVTSIYIHVHNSH